MRRTFLHSSLSSLSGRWAVYVVYDTIAAFVVRLGKESGVDRVGMHVSGNTCGSDGPNEQDYSIGRRFDHQVKFWREKRIQKYGPKLTLMPSLTSPVRFCVYSGCRGPYPDSALRKGRLWIIDSEAACPDTFSFAAHGKMLPPWRLIFSPHFLFPNPHLWHNSALLLLVLVLFPRSASASC